MRTDGSDAKRLTTMNTTVPNNTENTGQLQLACVVAISPSGDFMLGEIQDDVIRQTGCVRVIRLQHGTQDSAANR
jgi:hypothetical protein